MENMQKRLGSEAERVEAIDKVVKLINELPTEKILAASIIIAEEVINEGDGEKDAKIHTYLIGDPRQVLALQIIGAEQANEMNEQLMGQPSGTQLH